MYYLNKDSKSRWIQEYHSNLSIRHIQTYVVMVPQGVSNTITLSTWELLHQRNNIIAANRQKLHQSTVKPRVLRVLNTANDALRLIYSKIYGKEPQYLEGGYSQKIWVGVCGPLLKTLTLFMTNICDFPYPIYDLTKNLIPYLWPDP